MRLNARATLKQISYARNLEIDFPPDITQGDIHLLINQKAKRKAPPPTPLQIQIAEKFGLDYKKAGMSSHYLGDLIVETLVAYFCVDDVIKHNGRLYTIRGINEFNDTWAVHLKSHETGAVQRHALFTIALAEHVKTA